jgi:hypothetical protein
MFDHALHMMSFPYSIFLIKKNGEKLQDFFLFLAYQILHVFSPDISILYTLIYFA